MSKTIVNLRTTTIGAALGAAACAFALPAVASAQNVQNQYAPTSSGPNGSYETTAPQMSQANQLRRLQRMGFIGSSNVLFSPVGPRRASNFGPLPQDQLKSTLDHVQVNAGARGVVSSLRVYLDSHGIPPDRIAGVIVGPNSVIVAYRGKPGDPAGQL